MPRVKVFSRLTSHLICCRNWMKPREAACVTRSCATRWFVKRRWRNWHLGCRRLLRQACKLLLTPSHHRYHKVRSHRTVIQSEELVWGQRAKLAMPAPSMRPWSPAEQPEEQQQTLLDQVCPGQSIP